MLDMSAMKPYDNTTATLSWHGALISIKSELCLEAGCWCARTVYVLLESSRSLSAEQHGANGTKP